MYGYTMNKKAVSDRLRRIEGQEHLPEVLRTPDVPVPARDVLHLDGRRRGGRGGALPGARARTRRPEREVIEASVTWNYTTFLNIVFLALSAVLVVRFLR